MPRMVVLVVAEEVQPCDDRYKSIQTPDILGLGATSTHLSRNSQPTRLPRMGRS
jgi:hypothetical protein